MATSGRAGGRARSRTRRARSFLASLEPRFPGTGIVRPSARRRSPARHARRTPPTTVCHIDHTSRVCTWAQRTTPSRPPEFFALRSEAVRPPRNRFGLPGPPRGLPNSDRRRVDTRRNSGRGRRREPRRPGPRGSRRRGWGPDTTSSGAGGSSDTSRPPGSGGGARALQGDTHNIHSPRGAPMRQMDYLKFLSPARPLSKIAPEVTVGGQRP